MSDNMLATVAGELSAAHRIVEQLRDDPAEPLRVIVRRDESSEQLIESDDRVGDDNATAGQHVEQPIGDESTDPHGRVVVSDNDSCRSIRAGQ